MYWIAWCLLVLGLGAMVISRILGASPRAARTIMGIGVALGVAAFLLWIVRYNLALNP